MNSPLAQVLLVLMPYLVPVIVALNVALAKLLLGKLPQSQRMEAEALINACVMAVEQSMPGAGGPEKKQAAESLIADVLTSVHVKVPAALIDTFIEAAVAQLPPSEPSSASAVPSGQMGFSKL